jgi:UDPglucose 6-dehydrogenase
MVSSREPVAVIGTGYVGLVTAAGFAELGNEVWCVDVDAAKIARLRGGEIPIYEPGLAESVTRNAGLLHFSTELAPALEHARLLFVAVGTPPTYSGDADLSAVYAVVDSMPPSSTHALVMKSTVPVGTGEAIMRVLAERAKGDVAYVSCPEFLKEGSALQDFLHPDRVVVGDNGDWAGDAVVELYRPLDAPLVRTDIASAEMIKLAANAFLATKISFINEIANVCEETGADVQEVARGMGLDRRIGTHFLRPGIGFGGSCLGPEETVLVRHRGRITLVRFDHLWDRLRAEHDELEDGLVEPHNLEVMSWVPGGAEPRFMPVMCMTRRDHDGELIEVRTKMGRRIRTTPDHPWIVADGRSCREPIVKLARDLTTDDWVPLPIGHAEAGAGAAVASLLSAAEAAEITPDKLIVRTSRERVMELAGRSIVDRRRVFERSRSVAARTGEVKRTGTLRWDELAVAEMPIEGSAISTVKNGNYPRSEVSLDIAFWRVVGLYLAEGHANDGTLQWTFHPSREEHLVDELAAYWLRQNVHLRTGRTATGRIVAVRSRLLASWFTRVLGLGRNCYEHRLPDLVWEQGAGPRWALLSGLFEGDGSWSLINGGPSVTIEFGTVSDELADGVLRLLASVGIVASRRIGRTSRSTKDTHWIRISGADQVEQAIGLVPERDRPGVLASVARQQKRSAPTGYRRFDEQPAWVRVTSSQRQPYSGPVFSLEVPYTHNFLTSGNIGLHNCFPKDVAALKQLAGNSGYHFQLLTSVIEVNELQKRRVIGKLQKHLGPLVGKRIALLGLAFKPNTDDMREASSLVLAARLQADGARVSAYDPVAEVEARKLMGGVEFAASALDAATGADALVLVTEWPEFAQLDWSQVARVAAGRVVVDGRNFLDPRSVRAAGLVYEGVGR